MTIRASELLLELRFPFVAFGRANPEWDFCYVDVDGLCRGARP